jgi:hypothetical protein
MVVDPQHPMTKHYSRILNNVRGNEKETDMHNYVTRKGMNYLKSDVKLIGKRKLTSRSNKLKQDVQMLEHDMQI